jgi:hypothetical protein
MADASSALGAPQLAGTWVNNKGTAKRLVASVAGREIAGAVGSVAAGSVAARSSGDGAATDTPDFGRDAYLAVSDSEVALVKAKQGLMKLKLTDEVHARAPRTEVVSAELGNGKLACPLTITFGNGSRWEVDVPRGGKSAAEQVVSLLAG